MIELGQGFPEWTELGQDSGLDPLGMQRPIEAIYQSLLPGISTITLRFRYCAFFPWILKNYEDHIRHTDPAVCRRRTRSSSRSARPPPPVPETYRRYPP